MSNSQTKMKNYSKGGENGRKLTENKISDSQTEGKSSSKEASEKGRKYAKLLFRLLARRICELLSEKDPKFHNFLLGREVAIGKEMKFDDIVFKYEDADNAKNFIFIQVKHLLNDKCEKHTKNDKCKINSKNFSFDEINISKAHSMGREFYLQKYFISYLEILEELENSSSEKFKNGKIKCVSIYTNADLNTEDLKREGFSVEEVSDNINHFFTLDKSTSKNEKSNPYYRLKNVSNQLREIFIKSSDLLRVARILAHYVTKKIHWDILKNDKPPLTYYHVALGNEVIEKYYEGELKNDFLDNDEEGTRRDLRDAIFKAIREYGVAQKNMKDDELKDILIRSKLKLAPRFGQRMGGIDADFPEKTHKYYKTILQDIANEFVRYVFEDKIFGTVEDIIKKYHVPLTMNILDIDDSCKGRFRNDFLNNETAGPKKELRDAMFGAIKEFDESKKDMCNDELKLFLKKTQLRLVPNFGNAKEGNITSLPEKWKVVEENHINDFLNYLVFIVKQPDVDGLEKLISQKFQPTSIQSIVLEADLLNQIFDNIDSSFEKRYEKQLGIHEKESRKEMWLSEEDIRLYIDELEQAIILFAKTFHNEKKIMHYGVFDLLKKSDKLIDNLKGFLNNGDSGFMFIRTNETQLTTIKILQQIKNDQAFRYRITIELNDFNHIETRNSIEKSFQAEFISLFIIECRNSRNQTIEQLCKKYSGVISKVLNKHKENFSRKVILIAEQHVHDILNKELKGYIPNALLEEDIINLKDFNPRDNPFEKKVIFQGDEISLATLTEIKNWENYVENLSENKQDIIDGRTLIELFDNDKITVGFKPIGTSSIEGAYTTMYEEISLVTLSEVLLRKEEHGFHIFEEATESNEVNKTTDKSYIISGSDGKEKLESVMAKEIGNIGSASEIQIMDEQFNSEAFRKICHEYPEKETFWIISENTGNELKFVLQQYYNPDFYLKRKFKIKVIAVEAVKNQVIKKDLSQVFIFSDFSNLDELISFLSLTNDDEKEQIKSNLQSDKIMCFPLEKNAEAEFQKHCMQKQAVRWFKREEQQFTLWNSEVFNLKNDKFPNERSVIEEDDLIKLIKNRRIVLIADDAGVGKTTFLTKICDSKLISESHWVIRINLREHLQAIAKINLDEGLINIEHVIEFLCSGDSRLNNILTKNLLKCTLDKKGRFKKPLLLAFDGFDEVLYEENRNKVISLLKYLKDETCAKIWVTTRLHYKKTLQNALRTFAFEFTPLDNDAITRYIENYLKSPLRLILNEETFSKCFEGSCGKMLRYTEAFLNKIRSVFIDNISTFIGSPLQLYLMLEGSIGHFKTWSESKNENPSFNYLGNDICELYKAFIDRKYDIYFKKFNVKDPERQNKKIFCFKRHTKKLIKVLFLNRKQDKNFDIFKAEILSLGIIKFENGKFDFIHPTFRDYFAAKYFINRVVKKQPNELIKTQKPEYFLKEVLMRPDYEFVRTFLNIKLGRVINTGLSVESWNQFKNTAVRLLRKKQSPLIVDKVTILHIAVSESNSQIIWFLLKCVENRKDVLQKLLFKYKGSVGTSLHVAYQRDDLEIVTALLNAAAKIPDYALEEFLSTFIFESNASDRTLLRKNKIELFKEILKRVKNNLKLFLKKQNYTLVVDCFNFNEKMAKVLFDEFKRDETFLKQLLLYRYKDGNALYWAGFNNSLVEYLLSLAKEIRDNNETLKKLLVNERGRPILSHAAGYGNVDVLKTIIDFAKNINDDNVTFLQILSPDDFTDNALQTAAKYGQCNCMKTLLKAVASLNKGQIYLDKLIFATNKDGRNAIEITVMEGHKGIFEDAFKILEEEKFQGIREQAKRVFHKTVLYSMLNESIISNCMYSGKKALADAKGSNIYPEEKFSILFPNVNFGRTFNTLHIACKYGRLDFIRELISYALNINDDAETLKQLIAGSDFKNRIPFDLLENDYIREIDLILESSILEARNENKQEVANILENVKNKKYSLINVYSDTFDLDESDISLLFN